MKVVSVKRKNGTRIFVFRWRDRFRKWNESSSEIVDNGGKLARREAERKAAEMEVELENERISISWAAFCARYANEHLPSLAHKSAVAWHTARRKLEAIINPEQLLDVTADCLSIFAAKLRCQSVQLKENTITTYLRTIHAALSWAHKPAGLLERVPEINMPIRAKGVTKHMRGRPLLTEEVERLILATEKVRPRDYKRWRRLIDGLNLGGLRLKEALILSWDRSATISVFTDGEYLAYRFYAEGQKGHRDELLPMTPDFARFLLKTPPEMRHSLVFGMRLTEEYVGHVITKIGRRAKVIVSDDGKKCASAHDLRRTFGTRWATRVAPVELQRLMRHRSLDTTLKYYVLINSDALAKKLWASEGGELGGFAKKHQVAKEP